MWAHQKVGKLLPGYLTTRGWIGGFLEVIFSSKVLSTILIRIMELMVATNIKSLQVVLEEQREIYKFHSPNSEVFAMGHHPPFLEEEVKGVDMQEICNWDGAPLPSLICISLESSFSAFVLSGSQSFFFFFLN